MGFIGRERGCGGCVLRRKNWDGRFLNKKIVSGPGLGVEVGRVREKKVKHSPGRVSGKFYQGSKGVE